MVRCYGFATLPEAKLQLVIITSIENQKPSLCDTDNQKISFFCDRACPVRAESCDIITPTTKYAK
jgi:hypothetical protein